MALEELSVNNIARNRQPLETPPDSLPDDNPNPPTPNHRAKPGLLPTPSSIQSMLRNTTEIGDVGLLASEHARSNKRGVNESIIRPVHQTPPPRASSSIRSATRTPHQYGYPYHQPPGRGTPYSITRSQQGTVSGASSIYSMYRNRSETSFRSQPPIPPRGPSRGPEGIEDQSYFTLQHSSVNRSLATNQVQMSSHSQGQPDLRSHRPRSPFVYPTRLKRPGYRPSSPALSEVYRSTARSPHALNRAPIFRTNSPFSADRTTTGWQQSVNRLDPVLSRPYMYRNRQYASRQYFPDGQHRRINNPKVYHRAPTPMPISVYPHNPYVPNTENQSPPIFYDYSEGFQQEPYRYIPSSVTNGHQTTPEDSDRYFDELVTGGKDESEPQIFELAADVPPSVITAPGRSQKNHEEAGFESPKSVSKRISYAVSARRSAPVPNMVPEQADVAYKRISQARSTRDTMRCSSIATVYDVEKVDDNTMVRFAKTSDTKSDIEEKPQQPNITQNAPFVRQTLGHRMLSSYKRSQEFLAGGPNRTIGSANVSLYSRRSLSLSSSNGSMYSTQSASNPQPEHSQCQKGPDGDGALTGSSSPQQDPYAAPAIPQKVSPEAERSPRPEKAHTEIYSPIPKRSISSPVHRERFSSILSIDEGIPELDTAAQVSKRQARPSLANVVSKQIRTSDNVESPGRIFEESYSSPELQEISEAQAAVVQTDHQGSPMIRSQSYVDQACKTEREIEAREGSKLAETSRSLVRYSSASISGPTSSLKRSAINLQDPPRRIERVSQMHSNESVHKDPSDRASLQSAAHENPNEPQTINTRPLQPRSSIVSFAPPAQRGTAPLPFSFTPLRPKEGEDDDSVTELGNLAASYLNQPDRYDSEPSDTPPRRRERNTPGRASVITSITSKQGNIDSVHCEPEPPPALEFTVPEPTPDLRQVQPKSPTRSKIKVQRTSTSVKGTLKKQSRPSVENERASKENYKVRE